MFLLKMALLKLCQSRCQETKAGNQDDLGSILTISIIKGKLYRDTETMGKMDPFVEIEYNEKQYKTKVHEDGGKNPEWNESFDIPIQSMSDQVRITCYDEDALSNDLVGTQSFDMEKLCANQGINEWLVLEY